MISLEGSSIESLIKEGIKIQVILQELEPDTLIPSGQPFTIVLIPRVIPDDQGMVPELDKKHPNEVFIDTPLGKILAPLIMQLDANPIIYMDNGIIYQITYLNTI